MVQPRTVFVNVGIRAKGPNVHPTGNRGALSPLLLLLQIRILCAFWQSSAVARWHGRSAGLNAKAQLSRLFSDSLRYADQSSHPVWHMQRGQYAPSPTPLI